MELNNEFKGTKGKWKIDIRSINLETTIICGKIRVAQAKHYNEGEDDWTKYDPILEEGKANAKLIAAAPELLEALQMVKKSFKNKLIDSTSGNDFNVAGLLYTIEQAINKALNGIK
jgi:hypothetical protein